MRAKADPRDERLTVQKIRHQLNTLNLATRHAREIKAQTIACLCVYEKTAKSYSCRPNEPLSDLHRAMGGVAWLLVHITEIDDKRVLPSQRLALADSYQFLFNLCEKMTCI